jgi:excisionase family DNA binding protein
VRRKAYQTTNHYGDAMERKTYTVDETAEILGVDRQTIYRQCHAKKLPCLRIGDRFVLPRLRIDAMADGTESTEGRVA